MTNDALKELASKVPIFTRWQAGLLILLIAAVLATAWMVRPYFTKGTIVPPVSQSSENGANIGTVQDVDGDLHIFVGENSNPKGIEILPIRNVPERLASLGFPTTPPATTLRLISKNWNIDHQFEVSDTVSLDQIEGRILSVLPLYEHIKANVTKFETPAGGFWMSNCMMLANNKPIRDKMSLTIAETGLRDGDILHFEVTWTYRMEMNANVNADDSLPAISPPTYILP